MRSALGEFLDADEVRELAGGKRNLADQQAVLTADGIPFKLRDFASGPRILVSRYHVREWLSGRSITPSRGINLSVVK